MTFSILDFLEQLEPSKEKGKFTCPACGGNDFTVNKNTGGYNCWHDPSPAHRAEIRDALAPMVRWEKPFRSAGSYEFPYKDNNGTDLVVVHRSDDNGSKRIWQNFPTIDHSAPSHKVQLQEIKAHVLPYKYKEAIEESERSGLPIIIVEGELTCQSVWSIGLPSVTFLGGSKQYRTNGDYSHLFKKHKIVLAPDRDEQGVAFMREIETDNPGAQWLYADPRSWEWQNLPSGNGLDLADYIEEGATKDDLLASIVSKSKHAGQDGKPSYEEIISTIENFVGLYANDARIAYEASNWLEQRGVKMNQQNMVQIIEEAKSRIYGKEEIETIDALTIANSEQCREWLIAGIIPLGSVTLLAASGGTGKSTLIYNWALNIALGQSWSGRRCMQGKSLVIQSDEPLVDTSEKLNVIGFQDAGLEPGTIAFWENWRFGHMRLGSKRNPTGASLKIWNLHPRRMGFPRPRDQGEGTRTLPTSRPASTLHPNWVEPSGRGPGNASGGGGRGSAPRDRIQGLRISRTGRQQHRSSPGGIPRRRRRRLRQDHPASLRHPPFVPIVHRFSRPSPSPSPGRSRPGGSRSPRTAIRRRIR